MPNTKKYPHLDKPKSVKLFSSKFTKIFTLAPPGVGSIIEDELKFNMSDLYPDKLRGNTADVAATVNSPAQYAGIVNVSKNHEAKEATKSFVNIVSDGPFRHK